MKYLYEDYGRPVSLDRERRNISLRKFHALGDTTIEQLEGLQIAAACDIANTLDFVDYKDAIKQECWDVGEYAYCPDCKQKVGVSWHTMSDGEGSAECPECSFTFKG